MPEKQDNAQATYAPLLKKEDGRIDWTRAARGDSQPGARPAAVAGRLHQHFAARRCTSGERGRWSAAAGSRTVVSLKPPVVGCGRARWNWWKCSSKAASAWRPADFANGQR